MIALPGRKNLGLGRHWHFMTVQFWILTGLVYVALLFVVRRLALPGPDLMVDRARTSIHAVRDLPQRPPAEAKPGQPYQRAAAAGLLHRGLPAWRRCRSPPAPRCRQRSSPASRATRGCSAASRPRAHCTSSACAPSRRSSSCTPRWSSLHGLGDEFTAIVLASDPARASPTLALGIGLAGLVVDRASSTWSPPCSRCATAGACSASPARVVDPFERALSRPLTSHQHYTARDISPYHRVNGYPPARPRLPGAGRRPTSRDYRLERRRPGRAAAVVLPRGAARPRRDAARSPSTTASRAGRTSPNGAASHSPRCWSDCRPTPAARYRRLLRLRRQDDHRRRGPLRLLLRHHPARTWPPTLRRSSRST